MSVYDLNQLMREVNRNAELARRCSLRIDAIFDSYDLAAEERAALRGWDIRGLLAMGVNPYLLFAGWMAIRSDVAGYIGAVRQR